MIVSVFGGSFDPVHLGHENAVRSLLEAIPEIDRMIIMPARVNPFKTGKAPGASPEQRLEMCRIAFGETPKCEISDYEISRQEPSYTVHTLEHLHGKYPHSRFILALGSDSLESLPKWHRFEDIIRLADIAAVSRSDADSARILGYAENVENAGGRVKIIRTEPFEISSTEIRKKILKSEDISCYMNKNVVKYIVNEKIYG